MDSLKKLIEDLTQEASWIQIQGRALRPDEIARVQAIYQAVPHLIEAQRTDHDHLDHVQNCFGC